MVGWFLLSIDKDGGGGEGPTLLLVSSLSNEIQPHNSVSGLLLGWKAWLPHFMFSDNVIPTFDVEMTQHATLQ